jgi:hypothetical protein
MGKNTWGLPVLITNPGHQIDEGIGDIVVWHLVHLWDVQVLKLLH